MSALCQKRTLLELKAGRNARRFSSEIDWRTMKRLQPRVLKDDIKDIPRLLALTQQIGTVSGVYVMRSDL
jgi:hypothetical protein